MYGTLDEEKLEKIRNGVVISGIQYGPFWVDIENRQTSNTWLKITMTTGKNREIRKVMQKFSLMVNRLQRVSYGHYKIGNVRTLLIVLSKIPLKLQPGEIREAHVLPQIRRLNYMLLRAKLKEKKEEERLEKLKLAESSSYPNKEIAASALASERTRAIPVRNMQKKLT